MNVKLVEALQYYLTVRQGYKDDKVPYDSNNSFAYIILQNHVHSFRASLIEGGTLQLPVHEAMV